MLSGGCSPHGLHLLPSCTWQSSSQISRIHCCNWSASSLVPFICKLLPSWIISSIVRLAHCHILVSSQQMRWSSIYVCLVMADLSVKPLMHASLYSFRLVSSQHFVWRTPLCRCMVILDVHLLFHRKGVFGFSEGWMEGVSRLEHRSDVEVLTLSPDPLTNTTYVREVNSWWPFLLRSPSSSIRAMAAEAEQMKEWG